jgi:hypothetical protein
MHFQACPAILSTTPKTTTYDASKIQYSDYIDAFSSNLLKATIAEFLNFLCRRVCNKELIFNITL